MLSGAAVASDAGVALEPLGAAPTGSTSVTVAAGDDVIAATDLALAGLGADQLNLAAPAPDETPPALALAPAAATAPGGATAADGQSATDTTRPPRSAPTARPARSARRPTS